MSTGLNQLPDVQPDLFETEQDEPAGLWPDMGRWMLGELDEMPDTKKSPDKQGSALVEQD